MDAALGGRGITNIKFRGVIMRHCRHFRDANAVINAFPARFPTHFTHARLCDTYILPTLPRIHATRRGITMRTRARACAARRGEKGEKKKRISREYQTMTCSRLRHGAFVGMKEESEGDSCRRCRNLNASSWRDGGHHVMLCP